MKKGHKPKPYDIGLRPWHEVASEYQRRTGEKMYAQLAFMTASKAIRKIRVAIEPELRQMAVDAVD
jgi:hypothetical protein